MYVHAAFRADADRALAMLRERAFGTLVVADDGGRPVAVHVPFLAEPRDGGGVRVELHVARANPIHGLIAPAGRPALLTCTGPDAYVSPDWYGVPNQVPTWTYTAVHLTGTARISPMGANRDHVDRLSAAFEARLAPKRPWTTSKMEPHRVDAMMRAIVGIELLVDSEGVEAQLKLIQHKGETEHRGAIAGLRARGDAGSAGIAELMEATFRARSAR
jgi:transcriptional regulator